MVQRDAPRAPSTRTTRRRYDWRSTRDRLARARADLLDARALRTDPTYRELAAGFELADGSRRVYCYHVRKTAGTSLFLSFLALGGEDPHDVWRRLNSDPLQRTVSGRYAFASDHPKVIAEGAYLFARSHRDFDSVTLPPETFTVTVLRDPLRRALSLYEYLVAGDAPDAPGRVSEHQRSWARDGLDRFLDQVPDRHLLNQLATFSSRLDVGEAAERIGSCSSVFFTEGFTDGMHELGGRLGLPLEVQRARVSSVHCEPTVEQLDRLHARLDPEYRLFHRLERAGMVLPEPLR